MFVCVPHMLLLPQDKKKTVKPLELDISLGSVDGGCELPHGCWEWNSHVWVPAAKQPLGIKPSLRPLVQFLSFLLSKIQGTYLSQGFPMIWKLGWSSGL